VYGNYSPFVPEERPMHSKKKNISMRAAQRTSMDTRRLPRQGEFYLP
jgi:hypothetical protein